MKPSMWVIEYKYQGGWFIWQYKTFASRRSAREELEDINSLGENPPFRVVKYERVD